MIVGDNIRIYRAIHKITQMELARRAQMAQSTLCEIETGKTSAYTEETLKKIAEALNVKVADLWREPTDAAVNQL